MTRIKICGITNVEDARAAVNYGADALGFIFVRDSSRYVGSEDVAARLAEQTRSPFVSQVYVCNQITDSRLQSVALFDTIQYYSEDDQHLNLPQDKRYIRAFRVKDESSLEEIADALRRLKPEAILLDTYHKDKLGGSGETFNWEIAIEAKRRFDIPIILAGGLTPDNVAEAIRTVRPYAVDVSSGVEAEPGRKDHAKLRAFIQAVRRTDLFS